jgi:hypothetical protein
MNIFKRTIYYPNDSILGLKSQGLKGFENKGFFYGGGVASAFRRIKDKCYNY